MGDLLSNGMVDLTEPEMPDGGYASTTFDAMPDKRAPLRKPCEWSWMD